MLEFEPSWPYSCSYSPSYVRRIAEETNARIQKLAKVVAVEFDKEAQQKLTEALDHWNHYFAGFRGAVKIASDSPTDALSIPDAIYKSDLEPMVAVLDGLLQTSTLGETTLREKINGDVQRVLWVVLLPLMLAGLVVTIYQILFNRSLEKRVKHVVSVAQHLQSGDLKQRLPATNNDEISQMSKAINGFIARFEGILRDIHKTADQTRRTADGVSAMTQSVGINAKAQADKVFEVRRSIEEMEGTIKEMADHAGNVAEAANNTLEMVKKGNATGQQTVLAIGRIDEAVALSGVTIKELEAAIQRIGAVSNMIKAIAEQTNLLALNAAIEAARAGDQGRGFAVVADEVRKLAERTADSTSDISTIVSAIQNSIAQTSGAMGRARDEAQAGVTHGERMGEVLAEIDRSAHVVAEMVRHIARATEGHSAASSHIFASVEQVADIAVSTATDLTSTQNAMKDLAGSSKTVHEAVSQFKLADVAAA